VHSHPFAASARLVMLALLACLAWPSLATAQNRPARGYVGLSLLWTNRPAGPKDYHFITPMLGGTTVGVAGTLGIFVSPDRTLSIELGVSRPGTLAGDLKFDHFLRNYATAADAETMFAVSLRLHPPFRPVRFEPLGGLVFGFERIQLTNVINLTDLPNPKITRLPDASQVNVHLGYGGGADLVVDVARRAALTGSFRLACFPGRYDLPMVTEPNSVGIANWTYQAGAGFRLRF
jgi:hypothetical protein